MRPSDPQHSSEWYGGGMALHGAKVAQEGLEDMCSAERESTPAQGRCPVGVGRPDLDLRPRGGFRGQFRPGSVYCPPHPGRLPEDPRRANIDITSERPCYRPPSSRTGPERIAQHPVTVRPRGMGRVALRLWLVRAALRGWQAGPASSRAGRSLLGGGHRLLYSREVQSLQHSDL